MPIPEAKLENFERAFSDGCSGCRRTCNCGREFFDNCNSYDWDEGELERLIADPKSTGLDYSVGIVCFEGRDYVADCTCWHERAEKLMGFIDGHDHEIAHYLTLEKKRKQAIADFSPTVE